MVDNKSCGQSSVEFILLVIATFAIFLSIVYIYGIKMSTISSNQVYNKVMDIGNHIRDEIDTSSMVYDGYQRNFTVPSTIYGDEYKIHEYKNSYSVYVTLECRNILYSFEVPYYYGNLSIGKNEIKKIDGKIYLSKVD